MNIETSVTASPSKSKVRKPKKISEFFPHHQDAIVKKGESWTTLKYPLHKALVGKYHSDPDRIIGVRFGKETSYLAADIDRNSSIHPAKNPIGFGKFLDAMEKIGLGPTHLFEIVMVWRTACLFQSA